MSILDDPYYCGLRARVPNFVKMAKNGHSKAGPPLPRGYPRTQPAPSYAGAAYASSQSSQIYGHLPAHRPPPIIYHARSFESGLGKR
jgi:hypothetical protein